MECNGFLAVMEFTDFIPKKNDNFIGFSFTSNSFSHTSKGFYYFIAKFLVFVSLEFIKWPLFLAMCQFD